MKKSYHICKTVKCSNLNTEENICSFDDCIFTTAELKIKAETIENNEFTMFLIKHFSALSVLMLAMLLIYKKLRWI